MIPRPLVEWTSCVHRVAALALIALVLGCGPKNTYRSPAMTARVTDEAGVPVDGAIVVAMWELKKRGNWSIHEANPYESSGLLQIIEVQTDLNGRFDLPAWGPRDTADLRLSALAPTLVVYKRGLAPGAFWNEVGNESGLSVAASGLIASDLNGRVLVLDGPTERTSLEEMRGVANFSREVWDPAQAGEICGWEQAPRFVATLLNTTEGVDSESQEFPTLPRLYHGGSCKDPRSLVAYGLKHEVIDQYDPNLFEPLYVWSRTGSKTFSLEFLGSKRTEDYVSAEMNAPASGEVTVFGRSGSIANHRDLEVINMRSFQSVYPQIKGDRSFSTTIDVVKGDRLVLQASR